MVNEVPKKEAGAETDEEVAEELELAPETVLKGEAVAVVGVVGEFVDAVTKDVPKLRLNGEDIEELNTDVELVEVENGELVVVAFGVPSTVVLPKRDVDEDEDEPTLNRELPVEGAVLAGIELVVNREDVELAGTLLKSELEAVEGVLPKRDVEVVAWLNGVELPKIEEGAEELKSPVPEGPEDEDPKRLVPDAIIWRIID